MSPSAHAFAFPDTNCFLHFTFFNELNWSELLGAREVTLVLAPVVLVELDRAQKDQSRRVRKRATAVLRKIDEILADQNIGNVRAGVKLLALPSEPQIDFAAHQLSREIADDRLLASFLGYVKGDDPAFLITNDRPLRFKARHRAVAVIRLPETMRVSEEPDEHEKELQNLRRRIAEQEGARPNLRVGFENGDTKVNVVLKHPSSLTGEALAGAAVVNRRTGQATTTDASGTFGIQASAGDLLDIQLAGYAPLAITVTAARAYTVALSPVLAEDVVVVGSRYQSRTVVDSPVPIDVIDAWSLAQARGRGRSSAPSRRRT